jgi:3-oxoadipate CoA-transferase beta subunit
MSGFSKDQLAARIARDIPDGWYVNLGIGLPTLIANHLPAGREVVLHSENGILGMGPTPGDNERDMDLVNAGKQPVTLLPGGAFFHHADSFAMIRGGHLDLVVLGAFEVSPAGDLANWTVDDKSMPPGVGGAMDLAVGARHVWIMMEHTTKKGEARLVDRCRYPLTAAGAVHRVYTDIAVLDVTADGFVLRDTAPGIGLAEVQARTGATLRTA